MKQIVSIYHNRKTRRSLMLQAGSLSLGASMAPLLLPIQQAIAQSGGQSDTQSEFTLESMEQKVDADYDVSHLSYEELAELRQAAGDDLVVFDVRELDEYGVSHMPGAIQLDPGASRRRFRRNFADKLEGKHVVFYCSVGVRSSKMAERMQSVLKKAGVKSAHNLRGGVFRLHNDAVPLLQTVDGAKTDKVHPYDSYWGQLLTRGPNYFQYEP